MNIRNRKLIVKLRAEARNEMKFMSQERTKYIKKRYDALDVVRGITLISMILYHTVWDIVYIADYNWKWFDSDLAYIWQQSICWTFIVLSGFCWSMSGRKLRRGMLVFLAGALVTAITLIFLPKQQVIFGILTLLGVSMLLMMLLEKLCRKIHAGVGIAVSVCLFMLTRNLNIGELGFEKIHIMSIPDNCYDMGYGMTFLGFMDKHFFSTDYFSLFPWFFLFLVGYFLYRITKENKLLEKPSV